MGKIGRRSLVKGMFAGGILIGTSGQGCTVGDLLNFWQVIYEGTNPLVNGGDSDTDFNHLNSNNAYNIAAQGNILKIDNNGLVNMLGPPDNGVTIFDNNVEIVVYFDKDKPIKKVKVRMGLTKPAYLSVRNAYQVTLQKPAIPARDLVKVPGHCYIDYDEEPLNSGTLTPPGDEFFDLPLVAEGREPKSNRLYMSLDDRDMEGNRRGARISIDSFTAEY
jgi:hypothetical protein